MQNTVVPKPAKHFSLYLVEYEDIKNDLESSLGQGIMEQHLGRQRLASESNSVAESDSRSVLVIGGYKIFVSINIRLFFLYLQI